MEGASYEETYGIKCSGKSIEIDFVTKGAYGDNVGSRSYMMNTEDKYEVRRALAHSLTRSLAESLSR